MTKVYEPFNRCAVDLISAGGFRVSYSGTIGNDACLIKKGVTDAAQDFTTKNAGAHVSVKEMVFVTDAMGFESQYIFEIQCSAGVGVNSTLKNLAVFLQSRGLLSSPEKMLIENTVNRFPAAGKTP